MIGQGAPPAPLSSTVTDLGRANTGSACNRQASAVTFPFLQRKRFLSNSTSAYLSIIVGTCDMAPQQPHRGHMPIKSSIVKCRQSPLSIDRRKSLVVFSFVTSYLHRSMFTSSPPYLILVVNICPSIQREHHFVVVPSLRGINEGPLARHRQKVIGISTRRFISMPTTSLSYMHVDEGRPSTFK